MAILRLLDTPPSPPPTSETREDKACIIDVDFALQGMVADGCSSPSQGFITFHATHDAQILVGPRATNESNARRIALPVILGLGICLVIALGITIVYVRRQRQLRAEALASADEELLPRREEAPEGVPLGESDTSVEVEKEADRVELVDDESDVNPPVSMPTQPEADAQSVESVARSTTGNGIDGAVSVVH